MVETISSIPQPDRIAALRSAMLAEERFLSVAQARVITRVYRENETESTAVRRARATAASLDEIEIRIDSGELIVGNRTAGVRAGVVFPEAGISWVDEEIELLPTRPQDRFSVRPEDVEVFRREILPFWRGRTLEDRIKAELGEEVAGVAQVAKINQKDHAQGHICPNTEKWLHLGPAGILAEARAAAATRGGTDFHRAVEIVLEASRRFMRRYGELADRLADHLPSRMGVPSDAGGAGGAELGEVGRICRKLADEPPETFHEALQSVWFLYVILQMESNASSFSPGRADQYLYPYFRRDMNAGRIDLPQALELIECLWLKFNQIVYLRNAHSARYFAGFPIGFNVAVGGRTADGRCAANELSYLMLQAQAHIGLPQPNLSARIFAGSSDEFLDECSRVIGLGSGMPQVFNDEAVIPALEGVGIGHEDAVNYAIVGCVELTTHGNNLGWSDAAMFNMVKVLELALNDGVCMLSGARLGPATGTLEDVEDYEDLEERFRRQLDHFINRMMPLCRRVDEMHAEVLPSAFLSAVVDDCVARNVDVTAGGARYNLSGIQAIQVANIADSLAALRQLVFDSREISREALLTALRSDFDGPEGEIVRQKLLTGVPKYGNDVEWVDRIGARWVDYFASRMREHTNARGGPVHAGLYTVSAHVPMGQNVGATPDGRRAKAPLADGGMSAVYGRDAHGPTALLRSVSRIDSRNGSNGTLLNLKFLPSLFESRTGIKTFSSLLRAIVALKIIHAQFNVVDHADLVAARAHPEQYRSLTIRVAGYTAYFTELAPDLQDEIIARTEHATVS